MIAIDLSHFGVGEILRKSHLSDMAENTSNRVTQSNVNVLGRVKTERDNQEIVGSEQGVMHSFCCMCAVSYYIC